MVSNQLYRVSNQLFSHWKTCIQHGEMPACHVWLPGTVPHWISHLRIINPCVTQYEPLSTTSISLYNIKHLKHIKSPWYCWLILHCISIQSPIYSFISHYITSIRKRQHWGCYVAQVLHQPQGCATRQLGLRMHGRWWFPMAKYGRNMGEIWENQGEYRRAMGKHQRNMGKYFTNPHYFCRLIWEIREHIGTYWKMGNIWGNSRCRSPRWSFFFRSPQHSQLQHPDVAEAPIPACAKGHFCEILRPKLCISCVLYSSLH